MAVAARASRSKTLTRTARFEIALDTADLIAPRHVGDT
jgi:hypothetical protein